ncbi:hypothetical protein C7S16_3521 [Burkholderia thailandensis]|uniref:Uncharacterized protein n=1 Tax=Burkholderia thailandensis TaxID=57975 RepID=A0AAW9CY83_BURTH|nr:hypothetical protein [Burkholderia thailandensis]MDW9253802.1 hypothetical protein [Burkholderia thailandensis]
MRKRGQKDPARLCKSIACTQARRLCDGLPSVQWRFKHAKVRRQSAFRISL